MCRLQSRHPPILTEDRRTQTIQVEELRHQLKKGSEEVARLKREKQPAEEAMAAMKAVGETIKGHEERLRVIEEPLAHIALRTSESPPRLRAGWS